MRSKDHPKDHENGTHQPTPLGVFRFASGISRRELAEKAGISRNGLACLERGEYLPRLSTAKALAEVLGVPIQELFPEVGDAAE